MAALIQSCHFFERRNRMSDDLLHDCAESYKKLMNFEYEFQIAVNKTVRNFALIFEDSQFKHLSGLGKLADIDEFKENDSATLLYKIINRELDIQDVLRSDFVNTRINENSPNNVEYYVTDRLNELKHFYDNLHNMTSENLYVHLWKRECRPDLRPNHSKKAADYMFEFHNSTTQKADTETTCAFFLEIKEKTKNKAIGMSIIPTDISYSDDGSINVERCQILSVNEIDKERNTSVNLISAPEELREKAYSDSMSKAQSITIKQDIKALKSKRKDFSIKKDTKSQTAYQRRLDIFKNKNIYSVDMLNEVLKSLTSQLESQSNEDVGHLIEQEIKAIRNEIIKREIEKNAELPSGFQIVKFVQHYDGTISVTEPITTIKIPQFVDKTESAIKRAVHFVAVSAADIVSNIKNAFSKPNQKAHENKQTNRQPAKPEPKAVQSVKPKMPVQEHKQEKDPLFSIADLKSAKYAPTSSKGKDIIKKSLQTTDDASKTDTVSDPYYIKVESMEQIEKLRKANISFESKEMNDGSFIIRINKNDADNIRKILNKNKKSIKTI